MSDSTQTMPADVYTVTINGSAFKFRSDDPDVGKGFNRLVDMLKSFVDMDKKNVQDFADNTWSVVRGVCDLVGGTSFPGTEMFDKPLDDLAKAKQSVDTHTWPDAVDWIKIAAQDENDCCEKWAAYLKHTSEGAESTIKGLQVVVDVSIAVEAGLATGGLADAAGGGVLAEAAAGGLTGEVSSAAANAFDQKVEVILGERKEVDWAEVGKKGLEGLAAGVIGGLAGGAIKGWMTENLPSVVGKDYALFQRLAESLKEVTGETLEAEGLMTTAQQIWGDVMTKLPEAMLTSTFEATVKALGDKRASADELLTEWVKAVFEKDEAKTVVVDLLKSLVSH